MENYTYQSMLTGYRDRILRIALFDIFALLDKKQLKDCHEKPIDFFGLGLLSLLFFFESRLLRIKKRGVHELGSFIKETTQDMLFTQDSDYDALAKMIIEVFRPSEGKRNERKFYNYETMHWEKIDYSILKTDDWDSMKNLQYYTLDEQGLELVFATKEYFSEFQISISQMMLRKQLEKGEFLSALRQVDEMRINVNSIKDNILRIKHDIKRNITSEETYTRYKSLIKDINNRLRSEHDEFMELSQFIKETKGYFDPTSEHVEKDQKALELLVRIENELGHVHYLHSSLLHESIDLKTTALEAASESLYYAGITSFNFDAELARKITTLPIPFEESKQVARPYLGIETFVTWSPIAVFAPQLKESTHKSKHDLLFAQVKGEGQSSQLFERKKNMQEVLYLLHSGLKRMQSLGMTRVSVKDLIEECKYPEYMDTREFCDVWMMLHQLCPLNTTQFLQQQEHVLFDGIQRYFSDTHYIYAQELEEEIDLGEHYSMKNIEFWTEAE